ncbi:MAG: amino-acid N-acetyltransferase [Spirochaetaceae bacterium]|jgi:amino-acid N-acetyltransferase|nr:amino-acid N-acetyltransferase [Spirochaetaceae bacterium]
MAQEGGIDIVRDAFRYQNRFSGSKMVIKVDFPVTEDAGFSYLIKDLALVVKSGVKVVVVPGCAEWIDAALLSQNIVCRYAGTERITTQAALPFVEMAAFQAATRFITGLSGSRVDALIGNFVRARACGVIGGVDMLHTGEVDKIFAASLGRVLDFGMVPILPCIGWSPSGKPYNVSSDEIALAVSQSLGAVKLIIVSAGQFLPALEAGGFSIPEFIERGEDGRIIRLRPHEAETLLTLSHYKKFDVERPKWISQLELALRAAESGIERIHIIDGQEEGALLREIFTNLGSGTMIYADEQDLIRPMRSSEVPDVLHLMEPYVRRDILVRRSVDDIQEKKDDYVVLAIDDSIRACGALHDWGEGAAEIAALASDPAFTEMGLGRRIVDYLLTKARKAGFKRAFVLTTRTQDWFEAYGFAETPIDSLPARKRALYNPERKSKAYALDLF